MNKCLNFSGELITSIKIFEEELKLTRGVLATSNFELIEIADSQGGGSSSWDLLNVGTGFLQDAGYTTRKDGPNSRDRQDLLTQVFCGQQKLPGWLKDSVTAQWGAPNSVERFNKIRNIINVAIGTQKGRANPSIQAIKKWEDDMEFMDASLKSKIVVE